MNLNDICQEIIAKDLSEYLSERRNHDIGGVTGQILRGIVVPDEQKEQVEEMVKNRPHPYNEIPVLSFSEWADQV